MKNILIIANFTQLPSEKGNNRFIYLANMMKNKAKVEVITSSFSHRMKTQREEETNIEGYKITQIYEPGYKKNVSLKRFYSHYIFGKNVKKYLYNINKPDVIYCAVPSLSVSSNVAKYAKKNNIPFIIDVQDLWPEAFKIVLKVPIIKDIIFYPFNLMANYVYRSADKIVAVSKTYLNRALKVNKKCNSGLSIFLGTNLKEFDSFYKDEDKLRVNEEIKIVYIGTLGHSYNIKNIIDAISILKEQYNIKFLIMGDGPLRENFEKYAETKKINVEFTGIVPYKEMVKTLVNCDIAVNPILNSASSIINKVGDYAAAGLPVINTQESQEYRDLVEKYKIGYNCSNEDTEDIAEKIEELIKNKHLRIDMGNNNRKLAEELFNREKTYKEIIETILC